MTQYVLVSDIHGNYPALNAVVESEGLDANYLVLGDIHGLNAYPQETMALLEDMEPSVLLAGNHDKAMFHKGEGHVNSDQLSRFELSHTMTNLSQADKEWMKSLPFMEVWQDGQSRIAAAHAMPWPEKASGYEAGNAGVPKGNVPHFASIVADDYDFVFLGHSHDQFSLDASRWEHDVHFVNPGSLGYDDCYAVVDTESGNVYLRSVEYETDVKAHVQEVLPDDAPHTGVWF
jgi:predicted phosphodiesterase